jgi:hypothetical protein
VVLPVWANEEGVRWVLGWMHEKCEKGDDDERLVTQQQLEQQGSKGVDGVRQLDGNDLPLVFKVHQASLALQLPRAPRRS